MDDRMIYEGRKTFFVVPDQALLPESYLQDYLMHGYEAYIIGDDRYCPLEHKIDIIIETFPDSILFFYIDAEIPNITWKSYIAQLQNRWQGKILIGVLYTKRTSEAEKSAIEKYYLFDVGIQCGCIAMEYQKSKNFALIDRVMFANQAQGRRKTVRAICDTNCKVVYCDEKTKQNYIGVITDVSMSHFSCMFPNYVPPIRDYEKINGMLLTINGIHFATNAIMIARRETPAGFLFVFCFTKSNGQQGLESDILPRLVDKIYQIITSRVKTLLWHKFEEQGRIARTQEHRLYSAQDYL